jgi:hypothetical protein
MRGRHQFRNGLALWQYLRHFNRMNEVRSAAPVLLSRRFCIAPMMDWTN